MPSRQDQLHSYQFSVQRVVAALVMRDTDPAQSPFRKVAGATMAGALFAALGMAGAVVFALLGGSGSDWKADGQVIIEKESGARYVYYKPDGKLHPAINYASALLIADGAKPKATTFSRKSLNAAPRGAPMGIAGAPDSIPESGQLLKKPWTVCSGPGDTAGTGKPQSVVLVGQSVTAGDVLPATIERAPGVLLVSTRDDQAYLIYQNIRHRIVDPPTVLAAFAISSQNVVRVAPAFVNAVPAGPDIGPMQISGRGQRSTGVPGAKIGQVYIFSPIGGAKQYGVVLADGVAEISEAQAALLIADKDTPAPPKVDVSGPSNSVKGSATTMPKRLPFDSTPKAAGELNGTVCASIVDAQGVKEIRVKTTVPGVSVTATPKQTPSGGVLADQVSVPPGRGVLVEAMASANAPSGTLCLVTDLGIRYPLADPGLASKLGYGDADRVKLPAAVVAMLPAGPALDPKAARNIANA